MKPEQEHIDEIKDAFEKMQSREDLLLPIEFEAKPFVLGTNTVPFEMRQITWHANPKLGRKRYRQFVVKKKSGSR
jgi:hypothetical protein